MVNGKCIIGNLTDLDKFKMMLKQSTESGPKVWFYKNPWNFFGSFDHKVISSSKDQTKHFNCKIDNLELRGAL